MADTQEQLLAVVTSLLGTDYVRAVQDPSGTPASVNISLADFIALLGGGIISGPQSFGDNYVITPSVASNNLTVALKTVAGADPSSGDKITVRIGNTKREITAAISVTKNAGTNWCNAGSAELAARPIDFFVYLIQETGASAGTKIGFSRIPYARTMNDFVNTTTSEKYIAGNWTNFNATDEVENIGRFRAQLSAAAGHNWSIASALVINHPIYHTDWLSWAPTITGYSANPTNTVYRYRLLNNTVYIAVAEATAGTSNATTKTYTAPFTAATITNMVWGGATTINVDNGANQANGMMLISSNSNVINVYKSALVNWTASGSCRALPAAEMWYEV